MGDIGYKLLLVILGTGDFTGHVGEGCPQVTDFVLAVNLKFIVHVSGSILFCGFGDPAQGEINHLRKENQNDQGEQEQYDQHQVRNI